MSKKEEALSPVDPNQVMASLFEAKDLDILHLSLINVLEMIKDGEIDLILDQTQKTKEQKTAFVQKVIDDVRSPHLKNLFVALVKKEGIEAMREAKLSPIVRMIQKQADECQIVKLSVAIELKEPDIRELAEIAAKRLGKKTVLSIQVDKHLLGGAIVQHGSYMTDLSLKTRLSDYREQWHEAVVQK